MARGVDRGRGREYGSRVRMPGRKTRLPGGHPVTPRVADPGTLPPPPAEPGAMARAATERAQLHASSPYVAGGTGEPIGRSRLPIPRRDRRRLDTDVLLTMGALVALALLVVFQVATTERIPLADGCGYDGRWYCGMAEGQLAPAPFSRRVLTPAIVSVLGLSGAHGFAIANLIALAAVLILGIALIADGARSPRARTGQRVAAASALGALAIVGHRDTLHLYLSYPALTDLFALAFLLAVVWCTARAPTGRRWAIGAVTAAVLAALTRENAGLAIVAGAVASTAIGLVPRRLGALLAAGAAIATVIAVAAPSLAASPDGDSAGAIVRWATENFTTRDGFIRFVVMACIGLTPAAGLVIVAIRNLTLDRISTVAAVFAGAFTAISVLGGGDTDRILMPAGILAAIICLRLASLGTLRLGLAAVVVAAGLAWQAPWVDVGSTLDDWLAFWAIRVAPMGAVVTYGVVPIAVGAAVLLAAALMLRRRHETPTLPPPPAEPGAMARAAAENAARAARAARPAAEPSVAEGGASAPSHARGGPSKRHPPARKTRLEAVPAVLLILLASLAGAVVVARVGWPDGPWLWQPDLPQGTYPLAALFHQALGRGELPIWGDAVGLGAPLYAEGQIGALYPLNWLIYQLPPLVALDVVRVLHLTIAGLGAGLITLRLSGSRTGAVVTALLIVANGGIVSKLEWHQAVIAYGWLPWILLPLVWSRGRPTALSVAVAGAFFGIQALSGFPPYWFLSGLLATLVLAYRSGLRRSLWAVPLFGLVGLGVGAIQLIPTVVLVGLSTRSGGVGTENLFEFSATPFDFLFVAFANAFVPLRIPQWDIYEGWQPAVSFWALLEGYAFVGLPAIALAAVAARYQRTRAFLVLGGAAVALPIIGAMEPSFVASVPFVNGLRHPIRAYLFLDVAIAILAGIGLARLGRGRPVRIAFIVVAGLVVAYAAVTLAALSPTIFTELTGRLWAEPVDAEAVRSRAVAALTAPFPLVAELVIAGAVLTLLTLRRSRRTVAAVAFLTIAPLVTLTPFVNSLRTSDWFTQEGSELATAVLASDAAQLAAVNEPFYPSLVGALDASGPRPPHLHTSRFQLSLRVRASDELVSRLLYPSFDETLARAIGLDTLVVFRDGPCPGGRQLAYVASVGASICRIEGAARAPYWIPAGVVQPGTPRSGLLSPAEPTVDPAMAVSSARPAEVTAWTSDRSTLRVEAPDDGFVFIDRAWYPWWVASVGGRVVETQRLWSGMLVPVPAGIHEVDVRLIPLDAIVGALLSIACLMAIGVAVAQSQRRKRGLADVRPTDVAGDGSA